MVKRTETDIPRASKEVILEAAKLTNPEARFLVSNYYAAQEMRKRVDMQLRHQGDSDGVEGLAVLSYTGDAFATIENDVRKALKKYAEASKVGRWMMANHGVAEVIAAGFLAYLDIEQAPTNGHFMSFAGINPLQKWEKGEKRPYCADVKQICYHFGECMKRASSNPLCFYGQFYRERKAFLVAKNEAGAYAERAKTFYTKSSDVKKTLAQGKLPAGNIDRQACNQTAKIFLSHLHAVMYWDHYKTIPVKPYAMVMQGHAHEVKIPHLELWPGLEEAYYGTRSREAAE